VLAAIASLGVHALFVAPFVWGASSKALRAPSQISVLGDAMATSPGSALQGVELSDTSSSSSTDETRGAISPAIFAKIAVPDASLPNLVADGAPDSPDPAAADVDTTLASQLAGRYLGQIDARIERAWLRPRTPIGADLFACRARILQDSAGNVLEVNLESCNGTARWQASLVSAIKTASPLAAPPDPRVFARIVRLDFKSLAYTPGASSEQYEPELLVASTDESTQSTAQRTPKELGDAMRGSESKDGSIDLRIQGSHRPQSGESREVRDGPAPEDRVNN